MKGKRKGKDFFRNSKVLGWGRKQDWLAIVYTEKFLHNLIKRQKLGFIVKGSLA
jgi:hypothetical protein